MIGSLDFRVVIFVAGMMAIPATCLIYAWFTREKFSLLKSTREKLPYFGLYAASLSILLTSLFLGRLLYLDTPSPRKPPEAIWINLNWLSIFCWLSVFFMAAIGKGKLRLALFIWWITFPVFAGFLYLAIYSY